MVYPQGRIFPRRAALEAAKREFQEETGFAVEGSFLELGSVKQPGGKMVFAWAVEGDCDPGKLISNLCQIEWPPRSGRLIEIPEVDRGAWFSLSEAKERIFKSQAPFLDMLLQKLTVESAT